MKGVPFSSRTAPAWIALEGAVNVRDVGGGLIRADNLQGLTPADVRELVERRGVKRVVDLRTTPEVELEGPGPLVGLVEHEHRSLYPETGGHTDIDAETVVPWRAGAVALPREDETLTVRVYMAYLDHRPDSIVGALRAVAHTDGAVVVHCAAGKDRTGIVVALALAAAGVDRATIVEDYAVTAQRIEGIVARLAASPTYAPEIRADDPRSHAPRPETMERVLELLDAEHGGPERWLRGHGLTDEDVQGLRLRLGG